ncbi:MAG: HAMP domain-containing histidine kinase [Puniceicoccales bacterium]|jgi:signal transduction histidine kinase|nr:HAMP domain-containing histidine kinase [Puniceicoccales bacterium]
MVKGIYFSFFLSYIAAATLLLLAGINASIIAIVAALFLWGFYFFHQKCLQKVLSQLHALYDIAQVRGIFTSVASHELRNPMATIYSSVDLIENYPESLSESEKAHLFENVRKNIHRMTKMMDDIVTIGKLQHKQIFCLPEETNILSLCSTICESLEPFKERIEITIPFQLPLSVIIDQALVDLILSNLLNNALKYSDRPVKLLINFKNNSLVFDVVDKGIGIPESEIEKLSQLFGRCSNTGTRKGIGIGMFLVTHCVKLHRGRMQIFSKQNQGTHFRITLPVLHVQNIAH